MTTKPQQQGTNLLYALIAQARSYSDTIIMGRGDPDFDTPPHIIAAAKDAMVSHHADHVPPEGLLSLREAIAARVKRINNIDVSPETEVVVTNGGQEALLLMILAAVQPGDEIIIPEPNYNTYHDALKFARGVKVAVPSSAETNFRTDPAAVRRAITERTRAISAGVAE
ncbi:MAG: aminotransferase class I/II-fold pyridoxal phosphate-dependent enzyme [Chloroflexi bacterium]|nr:aminotransferase class I/II-fold pyridoxal phosphate-dependent enzyme [Chloroflexota bacterium]